MNNHRQVTVAWRMYTDENRDELLYSMLNPPRVWMTGVLDFDANNRSNWDVEQDIKKSQLWSYCGNSLALFKCPADASTIKPSSGPFAGRRCLACAACR